MQCCAVCTVLCCAGERTTQYDIVLYLRSFGAKLYVHEQSQGQGQGQQCDDDRLCLHGVGIRNGAGDKILHTI